MRQFACLLLLAIAACTAPATAPPHRIIVFFQEWSAAIDTPASNAITQPRNGRRTIRATRSKSPASPTPPAAPPPTIHVAHAGAGGGGPACHRRRGPLPHRHRRAGGHRLHPDQPGKPPRRDRHRRLLSVDLPFPHLVADPEATVRRVFGFPGFRGLQQQVIHHVLGGGDALVLMPTGGGKSLCYQVPALCLPGTTVVVSPLIALMDDQVAALRQLGIAAGALHSDLDPAEARGVTRDLIEGQLDLLYVSPERLLGNGTLDRLSRLKVALIAIDEAHCVSQWGHEFRPEYRALASLAEHFPGVPRIALTATADPRTRTDILRGLAMPEAEVFVASFHRPNLAIAAAPKIGEIAQLLDVLARHGGECGIVYCGPRAKTERIAKKLQDEAFRPCHFTPG